MELSAYLKSFTIIACVYLAGTFLAWVFLVDYRHYLAGLMLGGAASAVNVHLLGARIQRVTDHVIQAKDSDRKKRYSIGFVSRVSMALIAVMFAIRYEEIHLPSTIAGLLFGSVAVYALGLVSLLRKRN